MCVALLFIQLYSVRKYCVWFYSQVPCSLSIHHCLIYGDVMFIVYLITLHNVQGWHVYTCSVLYGCDLPPRLVGYFLSMFILNLCVNLCVYVYTNACTPCTIVCAHVSVSMPVEACSYLQRTSLIIVMWFEANLWWSLTGFSPENSVSVVKKFTPCPWAWPPQEIRLEPWW